MKKYCPKCNAVFGEEMKFCIRCGEALVAQSEQERKDRGIIKLVLILLLLCVGGGAAFWAVNYFSAEQKVLRMLEAGNYEKAQAIYFENIAGNEEAEKSISESLKQQLAQVKNDYIEGEIDYDTAIEKLSVIKAMGEDNPSYRETEQYITDLKKSRDAYQSAESFLAMEDYVEAIRQYELVTDIDGNYEDAQSKLASCREVYKENILSKAEAYAAENDFYDAVAVLNYALQILTDDNDLQILIVKYQKDEISIMLKSYESSGDYAGGITYGYEHQDIILSDPELSALLESYVNMYRSSILSQAENMFAEQGYEAALTVVNEGLAILADDNLLKEAAENYLSYEPASLFDMFMLSGSDGWEDRVFDVYDNAGNNYSSCYGLELYGSKSSSPERTYILDGKYTKLEGTLALSADDKNIYFSVGLGFYGDGQLLGYTEMLGAGTRPISFSFDVSGVTDLTVVEISTADFRSRITLYSNGIYLYK